jgi:hypothetical protein
MSAFIADTIEEAYQIYDWLFVFKEAMVTHLHADCTVDATAVLEHQEKAIKKLKMIKNTKQVPCNHGYSDSMMRSKSAKRWEQM